MFLEINNILVICILILPLLNILFNLILVEISSHSLDYLRYNYYFFYIFFVGCILLNDKKTRQELYMSILLLCIVSFIILLLNYRKNIKVNIDIIFLMPVIEEYLYRYILLRGSFSWGMFIFGAISFGGLHYIGGLKEIISKSAIGLLLEIVFIYTKNLFICIVVHSILNFIIIKLKRW